jgi:AraC family transcriptional regulator, transcriptional activator of pobA
VKTEIINYDFKPGLPQEFEIVDIAELYKEFKETLKVNFRTGFYHIIWFQKGTIKHLYKPIRCYL